MKSIDITKFARPHILNLKPYSSARDEYTGVAGTFLDANENPLGSATDENFNRYPDPYQWEVKKALSPIKGVNPENTFLGNGSDEAIDLLFRAFCEPKADNVITLPPTYGMYQVCADINLVDVITVPLTTDFQLDVDGILKAVTPSTKLIFICNPNNPTGNKLDEKAILKILDEFNGLVVIDEAYIDFSDHTSFTNLLSEYQNLVVLQTFSKAWGLAALRIGMAFASKEIITLLNKIKYPYNINQLTQEKALESLKNVRKKEQMVREILQERAELIKVFEQLPLVKHIYPSHANFLLIKVDEPVKIYQFLIDKLIIVRDRSKVMLCEGCLRITVGTTKENKDLIEALKAFQ